MTTPAAPTGPPPNPPWILRTPWVAGLLLAGALVLLYAGTLRGPFLFDDVPAILENPNIESLTPLSRALDAENGNGADRRPLVALSLAVNYALGKRDVYGYHVFNLGVHVLAALALFGLLRQSQLLLAERSGSRSPPRRAQAATLCSFLIALAWAVHPLHTSTLHMVINRNELMVGLFAFSTLYAIAHSFRSERPAGWVGLAISACLLGAASKEVIAAVPLVALLYDRTFHSPSLRAALGSGRVLYGGLALSWIALAFLATTGTRGESAGFGLPGFGPLAYLFTQTGALLHYLGLTFWPATLAFDYDGWAIPKGLGECWPQGCAVIVLLAMAAYSWRRGHVAGFLGLSCFLVLSPSSSFIPLSGALVAEHRMYIPSAALLAAAACLFGRGLTHLPAPLRGTLVLVLGLGAAGAFAARTWVRNQDFVSARTLWGSTVDVRPGNARAWNSYGMALKAEGLIDPARFAYERALAIEPKHYRALINLGNIHFGAQDWDAAESIYQRALARNPAESDVHYYLGLIAVNRDNPRLAVLHLRRALVGKLSGPLRNAAQQSLAWTLATASEPGVRDGAEALRLARDLDQRTGSRNPRVLDALACALAETGDMEGAQQTAARAREIARSRGQTALVQQIEARQRAFATGTPWRSGS